MSYREPLYLVIGADSVVGAALVDLMEHMGVKATGTTRRPQRIDAENRVFLDLSSESETTIWQNGYSVAFLCAAVTSIAACEDDPVGTRTINVRNTVVLAERLLAEGTRIIFLSSNTVFDGLSAWPVENAPYSPTCEYGRQKASVERKLLSLSTPSAPVNIVRLSKILTSHSGIAANFLQHLFKGESCRAFEDLIMCPISLRYATNALMAIALSGQSGIWHLSGEEEMSYAAFARKLAMQVCADPALVESDTSNGALSRVSFRPIHPGLGMSRTREFLGIEPETPLRLLAALAEENSVRETHQ